MQISYPPPFKTAAILFIVAVSPPYFVAFSLLATSKVSLFSMMTRTTIPPALMSTKMMLNRYQKKGTLCLASNSCDGDVNVNETTKLLPPSRATIPKKNGQNKAKSTVVTEDENAWGVYNEAIIETMIQMRRKKNFNEENLSKCRSYLLSRKRYVEENVDSKKETEMDNTSSALKASMEIQEHRFRHGFNFTSNEYEYVRRALVKLGDMCAKNISRKNKNNGSTNCTEIDYRLPVTVAWYKLKETGFFPPENSLSTYMYILSCDHNNDRENSDDDESDGSNKFVAMIEDTLLEVITWHDVLYRQNEKTLTILMKSLVGRGRIDEAEEVFATSFDDNNGSYSTSLGSKDNIVKNNQCINQLGRLRTYMPLMEHYCEVGDLTSILRLYRKMQDSAFVHWDMDSYTLLLSSLARFGYFNNNNDHSKTGGKDYGPYLFDTLVSNMADNILEITEAAFQDLVEAFQIGCEDHSSFKSSRVSNKENNYLPIDFAVERVEILKNNGICPITDVKLRLLSISDSQRQHVHDTLLEMARTSTESFIDMNIDHQSIYVEKQRKQNKPMKNNLNPAAFENKESYGYQELLKFSEWLDNRQGDTFTAIVDGANVGYYGHSRIHYSSVMIMVEKLERMGERPLVVMPEKYAQSWSPKSNKKSREKDLEVIEW